MKMANLVNKFFLQTQLPLREWRRFRGKINIQRPRQPHYERARVIAVTTPIFPKPPINMNCFNDSHLTFKQKLANPYNDIIAREVFNWFDHSKMVGIFHWNSMNADDHFKARVVFHKQNMHLKSYGKSIIEKAINGTKYEAVRPLLLSKHCLVFSPEQDVLQMLKVAKKIPQLILIGGIVENTLMNKNEFTQFATMPNLQLAQANIVCTLNQAMSVLTQNLQAHQMQLTNILDVHSSSKAGDDPNR